MHVFRLCQFQYNKLFLVSLENCSVFLGIKRTNKWLHKTLIFKNLSKLNCTCTLNKVYIFVLEKKICNLI